MAEPFINDTYPKSYYDTVARQQSKDDLKTKTREWLSKPRVSTSGVAEILTFTFGKRSSISSISFDILSVGCTYEFTYVNSDGIELPLLRDDYNQISFTVQSKKDWQTWQNWEFDCQPCIATKLRIKMTRVDDENAPDIEYSVGMKNLAIKRVINSRDDAALGFKDNVDGLGNVISKTVKDWQPDKAIDDSDDTYWKSEPQISQDAVVDLYLDIRDEYGGPQYFDDIAIDPVYMGSQMNIYYTSDDTIGERLVSFDVYDSITDMAWTDQKGYSVDTSGAGAHPVNGTISTDLRKAQFDGSKSWCLYTNWWINSAEKLNIGQFDIGDNCTIAQTYNGDIRLKIDDPVSGPAYLLLKLPETNPVEYSNGNPDSSRVDTEIRLGVGVSSTDDGQKVNIRCRVLNYWRTTGEIKSDYYLTNSVRTSKQISAMPDGIPNDFRTGNEDIKIVGSSPREIALPPKSHIDIPLKDLDIPQEICDAYAHTTDGDSAVIEYLNNRLDGTLTYRTDEKYLNNAFFEIVKKSDEGKDDIKTWWNEYQDNSESILVINDQYVGTNWFWDPHFRQDGVWKPESSDGDYECSWEGVSNQSVSILRKHGNLLATNIIQSPKPLLAQWSKFDHKTQTYEDTNSGLHMVLGTDGASPITDGYATYRVEGNIIKGESYELTMLLSANNGHLPKVLFTQYRNSDTQKPIKTDVIFDGTGRTYDKLTPVAYDVDMDADTDYGILVFQQSDAVCDFIVSNVWLGTFFDWQFMLNHDIFWFDGDTTFTSTIGASENNEKLEITGRTRVRNLTKPPVNIPTNTRMVFSAIPIFGNDTVIFKDYGLFIYDGKDERYIAYSDGPIESGKRLELEFTTPANTRLLSFGFVGTLIDGTKVVWSNPMLCTVDDWNRLKEKGIDWFDGSTHASDLVSLGRYNQDFNLNPRNDEDSDLLGIIGSPSWALKRNFPGNIVYLSPGDNTYNVEDWIWAKSGQSFVFSFYTKSENGFARVQPYFEDRDGNQFYPDRYTSDKGDYDWYTIYARVSIPFGHKADWMHFGIHQSDPNAHTYIGDLHCYDNAMAFQHIEDYNKASVSHKTGVRMDDTLFSDTLVRVVNASEHGTVFIPFCSVMAANKTFGQILNTKVSCRYYLPSGSFMENLVIKQDSMPEAKYDKFISNPKQYLSPDSYDRSSTLANALVYGKFNEEPVLRGGSTDSMYMAKQWTPALIGQKLEKQTYVMPMTMKAKYIKLEFTQLTPQQYPIESSNVRSTYRIFPVDVINDMKERARVDNSIHNDKATVVGSSDIEAIRNMVGEKFDPDAYNTPGRTTNINRELYSNPDTEVITGRNPDGYIPGMTGTSLYDVTKRETTSSAYYTGDGKTATPSSTSGADDKRTTLYEDNAEYAVYYAQYNESLISLARRFKISDWKLLYEINDYVDDTAARESVPGRLPGYWVLPGQQVRIPVDIVKQMTSSSKVDVVRRTSSTQAITTVDDYMDPTNISKTIGPVAFSKTCVHHYQTKTEKRTQSIAYFVGIRDIKVRIVDLLSEHDNISWNFFSMDMPIWHINGGYLTSSNVFVPDFSTTSDMAVAETDMMHSQSYYRTVKLIATNRNSLMQRTYLNISETEAWHSANYWDLHPELDCTWASSVPDDPKVPEDNGGAWSSIRFAWGDTWVAPVTPGKHEQVWYDNELVGHIKVEPEDRRFDANGNQVPYVIDLGEMYIPKTALTSIGVSLYSLKPSSGIPSELETRLTLVSGRFDNDKVIDEEIGFKSDDLLEWQTFATSRKRLQDMEYKCKVQLSFNHFDRLDLYYKSAYIETGTMRVLMRNTSHVNEDDWEDVTPALDEGKSIYVFKNTGHDMQIKVEELDPQDWFSSLIVIPLYVPYEDAVDYVSDTIHSSFITDDASGGKPTGNTMRMGESRTLSVVATYENSQTRIFPGSSVDWVVSNPGIVTVNEDGVLVAHTVGSAYVKAIIGDYTTPPLEIDVTI